MFPRSVEDLPQLLTSRVLDDYAAYVVANSPQGTQEEEEHSSGESRRAGGETGNGNIPQSLEEALAPLELLFGKTALSAVGIALHGTEGIVRYVERQPPTEEDTRGGSSPTVHRQQTREETQPPSATPGLVDSRRCLYRVGEHTLLSPYFCPCSAYAFQSIRREESYYCKHLLALQIALRVESTGIRQDNILVREVEPATFEALALGELV